MARSTSGQFLAMATSGSQVGKGKFQVREPAVPTFGNRLLKIYLFETMQLSL
jgi:hypothetical protein